MIGGNYRSTKTFGTLIAKWYVATKNSFCLFQHTSNAARKWIMRFKEHASDRIRTSVSSNLDPTAGFASATVLKDTQPVRTVAWDRDGNFLAVGSNSRTLRICHVWGVTGEEPGSRSSREHAKAGQPKPTQTLRGFGQGSTHTGFVSWEVVTLFGLRLSSVTNLICPGENKNSSPLVVCLRARSASKRIPGSNFGETL